MGNTWPKIWNGDLEFFFLQRMSPIKIYEIITSANWMDIYFDWVIDWLIDHYMDGLKEKWKVQRMEMIEKQLMDGWRDG